MAESSSSESLTPEQALVKAVNRLGGQSAMARLLELAQSTVWEWLNKPDGNVLPAEHVFRVEAATGISRHDLRPDIYPRGLQDDVPFLPAANLSDEPDLVADESDPELQGSRRPAA